VSNFDYLLDLIDALMFDEDEEAGEDEALMKRDRKGVTFQPLRSFDVLPHRTRS